MNFFVTAFYHHIYRSPNGIFKKKNCRYLARFYMLCLLFVYSRRFAVDISKLAHIPSSCICVVSIYARPLSSSCLVFATHKPCWPPGVPPAQCPSLGRSRLSGVSVSCSLHMWHPSPATARYESGSALPAGVHVSEPPVWLRARTETGSADCTWAALDEALQLERREMNK